MKKEREREKTVMKEDEVKTLRNLEEQVRLSEQRLERLNGGQVNNLHRRTREHVKNKCLLQPHKTTFKFFNLFLLQYDIDSKQLMENLRRVKQEAELVASEVTLNFEL